MTADVPTPDSVRASTHASAALCPFHDGAATLDLLLAELDPRDRPLFDAALDLRSLAAAADDAEACAAQLFRVRRLIDDRYYFAFYRVRCWARRALRMQVRANRCANWITCELPLNCARMDEAVNTALAALPDHEASSPMVRVRFVFSETAVA
jgi:hypothetical protein